LIDNTLPPGTSITGTLQQSFSLFFLDLFGDGGAPKDLAALELLDDLYIESLVRAFPHQTCVAKAALTKTRSGLNIFIRANTVLISEAFFPEKLARVKSDFQSLRASASLHAFKILGDVMSPGKLRSANLEQLIHIIVVLALFAEQVLDLIDRRDQPPSIWSQTERGMQDRLATELIHHLRYLIFAAFTSSSGLLDFLDARKPKQLLENSFWEMLPNEADRVFGVIQSYTADWPWKTHSRSSGHNCRYQWRVDSHGLD
jgi:hypothetical protein